MYIYKITNIKTNKVYVGQTKLTIQERWKSHVSDFKYLVKNKIYLSRLYNSMSKHGIECFVVEELEKVDKLSINDREKFWISFLDTKNPEKGYNINEGGIGGDNLTNHPKLEEIKNTISKKVVDSNRWTQEKREAQGILTKQMIKDGKMSTYLFNSKNNPMYLEKNKKYGSENPMSNPKVREKYDLACKNKDYVIIGKKISKKLSGKPKSKEHIEKMSESRRKYKLIAFKDGIEIKTISNNNELKDFLNKTNKYLNISVIVAGVLNLKQKKKYGYQWKIFNLITQQYEN